VQANRVANALGEKRNHDGAPQAEKVVTLSQKHLKNWEDVDPLKFRPFKSTYYITMGTTP
jgi:hypothetical protein